MAGYIGGGGIGNIALTYGYQTFNFPLMFATVFILIAFVWIIRAWETVCHRSDGPISNL